MALAAPPGAALTLNGHAMVPQGRLLNVNLIADPAIKTDASHWRCFDAATRTGRDLIPGLVIAGGHSGYLRVEAKRRGTTEPVHMRYADPDLGPAVPIDGAEALRWSLLMAAQNATAHAQLEILDAAGEVLVRSVKTVPAWATGGINPAAYARVGERVEVPRDGVAARLTLQLHPLADADIAVLLFTDIQLSAVDDPAQPLADLLMPYAALRRALGAGELTLYTAPLDDVPAGSAPQPVILSHAGEDHTIAMRRAVAGSATIDESRGDLIVTPGTATGRLAVLADGVWLHDLYGSGDSASATFPLPPAYLDNRPHTFSLVSAAGCHARCEAATLPVSTDWAVAQAQVLAPLPGAGAPLAAHRYRALAQSAERAAAGGQSAWQTAHLPKLHEALVRGAEHARPFALQFECVDRPAVSVLLAHDGDEGALFVTLASLVFAPVDAAFEVIVAGEAAAVEPLSIHEALTLVPLEGPCPRHHAINRAAARARGAVLVPLRTGSEVTAGWLDPLVQALAREDVGIAGPMLIDPDGRLGAAGGVIGPDLDPVRVGRAGNCHDPRYTYARMVDHVPADAMAVDAALWRDIAGLTEALSEDDALGADLALKAREKGQGARYVPAAVVVEREPAATRTRTGEVARAEPGASAAFKRRWAQHRRPAPAAPQTSVAALDRGITARVLFALVDVPRPDADAGSVAALEEIRMIQALGAKVTLITSTMDHVPVYADEVTAMGVEFIHAPFFRTMADFIAQRGGEFDAVYATKFQVLEDMLPALRRHAPNAKIMLNLADLQFLRQQRGAAHEDDPASGEEAERLRVRELAAIKAADVVCTYSDVETSVIESHVGAHVPTVTLPWVQRIEAEPAPFAGRAGAVFLGNYRHPPNAEAVHWFDAAVMPALRAADPGASFHAYGAHADELGTLTHTDVAGHAPNLQAMFDRHAVAVMPLKSGAGVKGKVFAALAAGIPIVATRIAVEGIAVRPGDHVLVADDPEGFAREIVRLSGDEALWHRLSESGRTLIRERYGFAAGAKGMQRVFETAGLFLPLP